MGPWQLQPQLQAVALEQTQAGDLEALRVLEWAQPLQTEMALTDG